MNNNFVVEIPKELKKIKSKLFFGLTKRQLIGFSIAIISGGLLFWWLSVISMDVGMYGLMIGAAPFIFATIYSKDGMAAETWIKLRLEYHFLNTKKRYYLITKKNKKIAERRKIKYAKKKKPISGVAAVSRS